MNNCTGFAIEENNFIKAPGAPGGNYFGLWIYDTKATNEVYKNRFENLSYANYADGQNWVTGHDELGLAYFCNENIGNYADFYVQEDEYGVAGIQSVQGYADNVTGNKLTPSGAKWHFYNNGAHFIDYYFCDYCDNENPGNIQTFRVNEQPESFENNCPSHYGGVGNIERGLVLTPEQKQEAELDFATNLTSYNNVKALYESLKDGGNTEATLSDVENAWPNDMWELRAELLGKSPHLSMDVLKAAADKTDVLPESVLFEILTANPDELKKEELISYLEDKENPLPEYMIVILKQVAGGTTYKTVLKQQMARYNQTKTRAAHDIIRSILNDSVINYDELRNWFDNIRGVRGDEQIIATYMQEDNFTDALALANMMPGLYGYVGDELIEHGYYLDMLNLHISLALEGRTIFGLDSVEVGNLVFIADNSKGVAGVQATNILEFAYGYRYCNCIEVDTCSYKSSKNVNYGSFNKAFGPEIDVKPNPADEWAVFSYTLPGSNTEGVIKITDISGKLIKIFNVEGKQGQKIWDTRKIKQGVYLYTFTANGITRSGKVVIK